MMQNQQTDALSSRVIVARNELMAALGDGAPRYLANMKLWFRQKWTQEEFDREARKFLSNEKIHLHNRFFIAMLNKIDATCIPQAPVIKEEKLDSKSNVKRKRPPAAVNEGPLTFQPYEVTDFLPNYNMDLIYPPADTDANLQMMPTYRSCVQERFLPDKSFLMGRFLIAAWEASINNVDEGVVEYLAVAAQMLMKDIIASIIMKRKHYKTTSEGAYYYDIGAPLKDPSLRNTATRQKLDDNVYELDKGITSQSYVRYPNDDATVLAACEEVEPKDHYKVTLEDVQRALSDHNTICSHSVYSTNMEIITQKMNDF